jgi:hypothetical protein
MKDHPPGTPAELDQEPLKVVAEALCGLRFGTVKLIIQDGVLVRVERTENRQVPRPTPRT